VVGRGSGPATVPENALEPDLVAAFELQHGAGFGGGGVSREKVLEDAADAGDLVGVGLVSWPLPR
jgi:hypothetical protein